MSEYQYYEWQTIDRPLTGSEQREVGGLSSHMDTVTSTQAIVTYSWGDFKHDPQKVLLKYFDAFLYDSYFGTRQLMFRLPKNLVDVSAIQPYLFEDRIMLEDHGKYSVLEIQINEESDFFEWIESNSVLGQLTPLREQLLQGDTRMLYLAWLKVISMDEREGMEEEIEPPVPAGLKKLNASLQAFADFFEEIHIYLGCGCWQPKSGISARARSRGCDREVDSRRKRCLSPLQIVRGEPGAVLALKKKLTHLLGGKPSSPPPPKRSAEELFEQAQKIGMEANCKAQAEAERQNISKMEKTCPSGRIRVAEC